MKNFTQNIIKDLKVDLTEEFDMNFKRKAFFNKPWKPTKLVNNKGSLMMRSGNLRNSISSKIQGTDILFSSSLPYASIHNEGGTITVTAKMKKFFWAMYYKSSGAIGKGSKQKNERLSIEAQQWKALALMKIGQKMKIEKRQFIGWHPTVNNRVESVFNDHLKDIETFINQRLKR